ncbi:MAG: BrnT family toxin [Gallionella sp.]|nr:BrnT family toxin [Gallionella sp.]
MESHFTWGEQKRAINLKKHDLDFVNAGWVLDSQFRLDVESIRKNEARTQSFAYVFDRLAVLTVVNLSGEQPHIISFRTASEEEREVYYEWLENDYTA